MKRRDEFWLAIAFCVSVCWVIVLGLVVFSFVQLSRTNPSEHRDNIFERNR